MIPGPDLLVTFIKETLCLLRRLTKEWVIDAKEVELLQKNLNLKDYRRQTDILDQWVNYPKSLVDSVVTIKKES